MDFNENSTTTRVCSRLKASEQGPGWQGFFETYWKLIYTTARASGLEQLDTDEVVQATLSTAYQWAQRRLPDPYQTSLKDQLRSAASRFIQDKWDQAAMVESDTARTGDWARIPSGRPTRPIAALLANWDSDWEKNLIEAALARVRSKSEPGHFQIFDLAFVRHWPARQISKALNISAAYVYLVKHRLSVRLWAELRALRRNHQELFSTAERN